MIWSCLQCLKHSPQINTKKSLDTVTIQSAVTISFQQQNRECYLRLPKRQIHPGNSFSWKLAIKKSLLKVTLVPGSAHTDIPIITAQKGLCVWKPENISSLHNSMFHSTEHYVGFFFFLFANYPNVFIIQSCLCDAGTQLRKWIQPFNNGVLKSTEESKQLAPACMYLPLKDVLNNFPETWAVLCSSSSHGAEGAELWGCSAGERGAPGAAPLAKHHHYCSAGFSSSSRPPLLKAMSSSFLLCNVQYS